MRLALVCAVSVLVSITTVSMAHHAPSAIFDMGAMVEIKGTLTDVRWVNPHIRLSFRPVEGSEATDEWVFESQPPQWFRRVGVSRTVFENALGETFQVAGRPARSGEPFGFLMRLTFQDGTAYQMVPDRGENFE